MLSGLPSPRTPPGRAVSPPPLRATEAVDWIDQLLLADTTGGQAEPLSPQHRHKEVCNYIDSFLKELSPSPSSPPPNEPAVPSGEQIESVTPPEQGGRQRSASTLTPAPPVSSHGLPAYMQNDKPVEAQASPPVRKQKAQGLAAQLNELADERATQVEEDNEAAFGIEIVLCTVKKGSHGLGMALETADDSFVVAAFNEMPQGVPNPGELAKPPIMLGDRIVAVDGVPCPTAEALGAQIQKASDEILLTMERNHQQGDGYEDLYEDVASLSNYDVAASFWSKQEKNLDPVLQSVSCSLSRPFSLSLLVHRAMLNDICG